MNAPATTAATIDDQPLHDWLAARFCCPDREKTRRPFWINGQMIYCDGRIMAAVDHPQQPTDTHATPVFDGMRWLGISSRRNRPFDVNKVLKALDFSQPIPHPPEVAGPDPTWNARWVEHLSECSECEGLGMVTCDYDHEHTCPDCDGQGDNTAVAEEAFSRIRYGRHGYARRLLWWASQLPGVEFFDDTLTKAPSHMLTFRFDGGVGCLMAMLEG